MKRKLKRRIDGFAFEEIFIGECYDLRRLRRWPDLTDAYRSIVAEGRTALIIDVGAKVGLSSYCFRALFPESLVVALEPEPSNFRLLSETLKDAPSTLCLEAGLAGADGSLAVVGSGLGPRLPGGPRRGIKWVSINVPWHKPSQMLL